MRLLVLFSFACAVAVSGGKRFGCPFGFWGYGSSCYMFSHTTATLAEALTLCKYLSSELATITSKSENDLIKGHLSRNGLGRNYFIDGNDLRAEGAWMWENPIRRMSFTDWGPGEPTNSGKGESCLAYYAPINYQWVDIVCQARIYFICEKKAK